MKFQVRQLYKIPRFSHFFPKKLVSQPLKSGEAAASPASPVPPPLYIHNYNLPFLGSNDTLMLHDIQSWAVMTEDGEPAVTQRMVNVLPLEYPDPASFVEEDIDIEGKDVITSFAWHPTEENCLVACRKNNHLAEVHVMERISPSWSSQHFLMWPHNGILR